MSLTNNEIKRYGRQLVLPEIRKEGQLRLKNASVLIVGMGGLGSPCAIYLATAGVGKLGLLDHDVVDLSNIHRQITHSEKTLGISKVESAAMFLKTLNSTIQYELYPTALTSTNALEIVKPYDIVIDCSDNVATRYLMNDACVLLNKPLVSGSAIRFEGQLTVYHAHHSPCYRCLFPIPPPSSTVSNCDDVGVLGPITGILGSMQALEAIKYLVHGRCNYLGKLLLLDGNEGTFRVIPLRPPQPHCQICGTHPVIRQLIDYPEFCGSGYDDKVTTKPKRNK
ncbi:Molybdenum cofactor synthesis protein 3 [Coelomomyces lativittatus]|nr:Molybdenum cofactor synthesis protein 3 [Coelomomyces lativittatus]KAJ1510228.1 Molybdenum cofactor synthesis protein 3 [Coelomomyces lativittatus]